MAATFFFGQFPTGEHQGGKETEIDVGGLEMGGIGLSEMPNQGAVGGCGRRDEQGLSLHHAGSVDAGEQPHGR
jgi:hypothetical protein